MAQGPTHHIESKSFEVEYLAGDFIHRASHGTFTGSGFHEFSRFFSRFARSFRDKRRSRAPYRSAKQAWSAEQTVTVSPSHE